MLKQTIQKKTEHDETIWGFFFLMGFGVQGKEPKILVPVKKRKESEGDRRTEELLPVRQLFPESIFPHFRSEGSEVWRGCGRCGRCCWCDWCERCGWCASASCPAQRLIRARSLAGSAAAPSEPPPWWPVSVHAGHGLLGGSEPQPPEGAECGHSPRKDGEILEKNRPTIKRTMPKGAVAEKKNLHSNNNKVFQISWF